MLVGYKKNYFQRGFVDILGIIIVVFLAATVFVGAKLTSDKDFTANFFGKAGSCSDNPCGPGLHCNGKGGCVPNGASDDSPTVEAGSGAVGTTGTDPGSGVGCGGSGYCASGTHCSAGLCIADAPKPVTPDVGTQCGNGRGECTVQYCPSGNCSCDNGFCIPRTTGPAVTTIPSSISINGSCDANGIPYQNGSVVVYGTNDYRKCVNGSWKTGDYKITDLTTVPSYLQDTYNNAKNTTPSEPQNSGSSSNPPPTKAIL